MTGSIWVDVLVVFLSAGVMGCCAIIADWCDQLKREGSDVVR